MNRLLALMLAGLMLVASSLEAQEAARPEPSLSPLEARAAFLKLLNRARVPLDIRSLGEYRPSANGVASERVDFATEKHPDGRLERVPALVARPALAKASARLPAVIVLHGTGGNKEANGPWIERLARRGFVAIAIDGRYHGERAGGEPGTKAYNEAITRAWRAKPGALREYPFYFDTCWDVWRTIDYLQTRSDVDPDRIGLIGISKGGIETWLAGAVDDRVKVAVPAIAVQSFRWSLEHDRFQARANTIKESHEAARADLGEPEVNARVCRTLWSKLIPGILDEFDGPNMLPLFAGRSLLILNGERDPNCPIEGAELAIESARKAFRQIDAEDHFQVIVARETGHAVTKAQEAAAVDWFVRWLKPEPPALTP